MKSGPTNRRTKCLRAGKQFSVTILATIVSAIALADATTDGSVGAVETKSGHFTIPESLGKKAGPNLFHSFTRFNINADESATFTTDSNSIQNVISRVTGREQSLINGPLTLLEAAGSSPEFFFINPAGVTFGAGAKIDVPAGFHVSTAQTLKFTDGFVWDPATNGSSLTIAAPESFGFVGGATAAVVTFSNSNIEFKSGRSLEVVAGTVQFDAARLSLVDGALRVAATGSTMIDVRLNTATPSPLLGTLNASNTEFSSAGGAMRFEGGNLNLTNNTITSSNNASGVQAEPIDLIGGNIRFDAGEISTSVSGPGAAGDINVRAQSMSLDNFAFFITNAGTGSARTGNINLNVRGELALRPGLILANADAGSVGAINIHAGTMTIDNRGNPFAGIISSQAIDTPKVPRAGITIRTDDALLIENGATIASSTFGAAPAGAIDIHAGSLVVDGSEAKAGINSGSFGESGGNAGAITITAVNDVFILGAGEISASTTGAGTGGNVSLSARTLAMDGKGAIAGILSDTDRAGAGGQIKVIVDNVSIRDGGVISAQTSGSAHAGNIQISSNRLSIEKAGAPDGPFTGLKTAQANKEGRGSAGNISLTAQAELFIGRGGEISSRTDGAGTGGSINIDAKSLTLDGQNLFARVSSETFGDGNAGNITIKAEDLSSNRGKIFSSTFGSGAGGAIGIETNVLALRGPDSDGSISALAGLGSSGQPGDVTIKARDSVKLTEASITNQNFAVVTGVPSHNPTSLSVSSPRITLVGGSRISAETSGNVTAGVILIAPFSPGGTLNLSGDGTAEISSSTRGSAPAGDIELNAGQLTLANLTLVSQAKTGSTGPAGRVNIAVDASLAILENARVATDTSAAGNAGNVFIRAGELVVDAAQVTSNSNEGASGSAGNIRLDVSGVLDLRNGAQISSSTRSEGAAGALALNVAGTATLSSGAHIATDTASVGNAGSVRISAANLRLDQAAVSSSTLAGSSGDGGSIEALVAEQLMLTDGGLISTSTLGTGRAGSIAIAAGDVHVLGEPSAIRAMAGLHSSGQTGDISMVAGHSVTLADGATLSIQNDAQRTNLSPSTSKAQRLESNSIGSGTLAISAPRIIVDNARISAAATGNMATSNLLLSASEAVTLRNASALTTSAQDGNGGSISISAGPLLRIDRSAISTSVNGRENGNGGDVTLAAQTLLMNTGFVQANTAAAQASGGNIDVDVGLLVASGTLVLGREPVDFDPTLVGLNVIQAASPGGISGNIRVSGPVLDPSALRTLSSAPEESPALESDLCRRSAGSTFTPIGRGGLRLRATQWIRPGDFAATTSGELFAVAAAHSTSQLECR